MLGGYIHDLEEGDVFKPVEYELTPFIAAEYAHGVEENCEWFHSSRSPWGRQVRPPTAIHTDKMRILEENCPKERRIHGMKGPQARIHYEYHAKSHSPAFVGERLTVSGRVLSRYVNRGRPYYHIELIVKASDGRLVETYRDRTVLQFEKLEGQK